MTQQCILLIWTVLLCIPSQLTVLSLKVISSYTVPYWEPLCLDQNYYLGSVYSLIPINATGLICDRFHLQSELQSFQLDGNGLIRIKSKLCFYNGCVPRYLKLDCLFESRLVEHITAGFNLCHEAGNQDGVTMDLGVKASRNLARQDRSLSRTLQFNQTTYTRQVIENSRIGTGVIDFSKLIKTKSYLDLEYTWNPQANSESGDIFELNINTGLVTISKKVDFEQFQIHRFEVKLREIGGGDSAAVCKLTIHVLDQNDNPPRFERQIFQKSISENVAIGTTIFTIQAFDDDISAGAEGTLVLSLPNPSEVGEFILKYSDNNWRFIVNRALDRETKSFYRTEVLVNDTSPKGGKTARAILEVTVTDVNDNKPQFVQSLYRVTVNESTHYSKPILNITATDADEGDNGELSYSILNGDKDNHFDIDFHTGQLKLTRPLKYQERPVELTIRARDKGKNTFKSQPLSNTSTVIIKILDINNNNPTFYTTLYEKQVDEDEPVGFQVFDFEAYDKDYGANKEIEFSLKDIDDLEAFPFTLNKLNGRLTLKNKLDRESQILYEFTAVVTDKGNPPRSSTVPVKVTILDVNDNAPKFPKNEYNVTIPETKPIGDRILVIRAQDPDTSDDKNIVYYEKEMDKHYFMLTTENDQAVILLQNELHYDPEQSQFVFQLLAVDTGKAVGSTQIRIIIEDVNSPPVFLSHPSEIMLSESQPPGPTTVFNFQAHDKDTGANADLTYSLKGSDAFAIDPQRGYLRVKTPLDREDISVHYLEVHVQDNGQPPLSADTRLQVNLDDVNDNAPIFLQPNYSTPIKEDFPEGKSIIEISARDADDDTKGNGLIEYFLREVILYGPNAHSPAAKNFSNSFSVDKSNGDIRSTQPLDRELVERYRLTVEAIDQPTSDEPALTARVYVYVTIEDVNDNGPKFEKEQFIFEVPENAEKGSVVDHIVATDADTGVYAEVSYTIFEGSGDFELRHSRDPSKLGRDIVTKVYMDYEDVARQSYHFKIMATSGTRTATATVTINVVDQNDHKPMLKDFFIVYNNLVGSKPTPKSDHWGMDHTAQFMDQHVGLRPSTTVGYIPAHDPDINDQLNFSIPHGNLAELLNLVNERTGEIRLNPRLETNRFLSAPMIACVTDGANEACSKLDLVVRPVTHEMLLNSVRFQINNATIETVLSPSIYQNLIKALSAMLVEEPNDVVIFSMANETRCKNGISDRFDDFSECHIFVNVSFSSWNKRRNTWHSVAKLREVIALNRALLGHQTGLSISIFEDDFCQVEPCVNFARCEISPRFESVQEFLTTDEFLFRPIKVDESFVCVCPPGFAGSSSSDQCDTEVNLCYSNPCHNNATCMSKEGGYNCICPPGFTGRLCDVPLLAANCFMNVCKGGARCNTDDLLRTVECSDCPYPHDYSTSLCELTTATFDGRRSFLAFPTLKTRYRFRIELSFTTIEPNGLIFFNGRFETKNDFMMLRLVNGHLEFVFSTGKTEKHHLMLKNVPGFNDARWHTVVIRYKDKHVILSVDGCDADLALSKSGPLVFSTPCAVQFRPTHPKVKPRFLDLTGPFYLGGIAKTAKTPIAITNRYFKGCIGNLNVDYAAVDLGFAMENYGRVQPGCDPFQNDCGRERPCGAKAVRCENVWDGYKCDCRDGYTGQNCTEKSSQVYGMKSSRSNIDWSVSTQEGRFSIPFEVGLSFRTNSRDCVLLKVVLNHQVFKFELQDGLVKVYIGNNAIEARYNQLDDGNWHTLAIQFVTSVRINLLVDYIPLVTAVIPDGISGFIKGIYSGVKAHGSSSKFIGCTKNIFVKNRSKKFLLTPKSNKNVELDCKPKSDCSGSSNCPRNSICVEHWNERMCECKEGYFGPMCESVCSGRLNPCQNGAECHNVAYYKNPSGYVCECPKGFSGTHCEDTLMLSCPKDWYGEAPVCGPCLCDQMKGFSGECNGATGACLCKPNHFKTENMCLPCNCYSKGSKNASCSVATGQCHCKGNAKGKMCDQCPSITQEIDPNGNCVGTTGQCPEQRLDGLLWPKTNFSKDVNISCPTGSLKTARRTCHHPRDGYWGDPDYFLCITHGFNQLGNQLEYRTMTQNMVERLMRQLYNQTLMIQSDPVRNGSLYGQDVKTAYQVLMMVLDQELKWKGLDLAYHRKKEFAEYIVVSASALLSDNSLHWWKRLAGSNNRNSRDKRETAGEPSKGEYLVANLINKLDRYGAHLASQYRQLYLEPFQLLTENIVFALEPIIDGQQSLRIPDNRNFVHSALPFAMPVGNLGELRRYEPDASVLFYSSYRNIEDLMPSVYDSSVVSHGYPLVVSSAILTVEIYDEYNKPIQFPNDDAIYVTLPITSRENKTNPQCVTWHTTRNGGQWSAKSCKLMDDNGTHIFCRCDDLSSYALLMDLTDGTYFIATDKILPYALPMISVATIVVILFVVLLRISISALRNSLNSILCLTLCICCIALLSFVFVTQAMVHQNACLAVGMLLHFAFVSLFLWLFCYLLHLYRIITDVKDLTHSPIWVYALIALGIPLILVLVITIIQSPSYTTHFCWLRLSDNFSWSMNGPIILALVLCFYVFGMCLVIGCSKNWQMLGVNLKQKVYKAVLLFSVCVFVWLISMLSINIQSIILHYVYLVALVILAVAVCLGYCLFDCEVKEAINDLLRSNKRPQKPSANGDLTATSAMLTSPRTSKEIGRVNSRTLSPPLPPAPYPEMDSSRPMLTDDDGDSNAPTIEAEDSYGAIHQRMQSPRRNQWPSDRMYADQYTMADTLSPRATFRPIKPNRSDTFNEPRLHGTADYLDNLPHNRELSKPDLIPSPDQSVRSTSLEFGSGFRSSPNSSGYHSLRYQSFSNTMSIVNPKPMVNTSGPNTLLRSQHPTRGSPILSPAYATISRHGHTPAGGILSPAPQVLAGTECDTLMSLASTGFGSRSSTLKSDSKFAQPVPLPTLSTFERFSPGSAASSGSGSGMETGTSSNASNSKYPFYSNDQIPYRSAMTKGWNGQRTYCNYNQSNSDAMK